MPTANDPPDKNNAPPGKSSPMSQAVTAERIDRAIAWYEANAQAIDAALPIVTPGVLYKKGYLEPLNRYISAWKGGNMPLQLAVCYVHRPITVFYEALSKPSAKQIASQLPSLLSDDAGDDPKAQG